MGILLTDKEKQGLQSEPRFFYYIKIIF